MEELTNQTQESKAENLDESLSIVNKKMYDLYYDSFNEKNTEKYRSNFEDISGYVENLNFEELLNKKTMKIRYLHFWKIYMKF